MTRGKKHQEQNEGEAGFGRRVAHTIAGAVIASGRSRSRIFLAIKNKELTAIKDGRATMITDDELRRWVSEMPTIGRTKSEVRNNA